MLSNLPPGCNSIPGDHDKTVSFDVSLLYTDYINEEDTLDELPEIIKQLVGVNVGVDMSTYKVLPDDMFEVIISYQDDIEMDVRGMDYSEIEDAVIEYLNDEVFTEIKLDRKDQSLEIDINIH